MSGSILEGVNHLNQLKLIDLVLFEFRKRTLKNNGRITCKDVHEI